MALNYPGPYGIRIFYTTTPAGFLPLTHKIEFNVRAVGTPAVGTPAESVQIELHGGGTIYVDQAVDQIITLMKPMYPAVTDFTLFELWRYAPTSFDATFITSDVIAVQGTNATASVPAGQSIITFRSAEGGSMKVHLMESSLGPGPQQAFPTSNAQVNAFSAMIVDPSSGFVFARDTSRPVSPKGLFPGQNERLWKKRYRTG